MTRQTDKYLEFLSNIVDGEHTYNLLLKHLHRIEFYSFVPNDDNRGEDGKKLREIYLNSKLSARIAEVDRLGPCTMLEMLIGLSFRIENELEGSREEIKCPDCFWMLMSNLDLAWCDDTQYFLNGSDDVIDYKVGVLLDRKYERNGVEGLFPLVRTRNDQRKIEIWYQMQEYLLENYEF